MLTKWSWPTSFCRAALSTFPQCFVVAVRSDGIGFGMNYDVGVVSIFCCVVVSVE